MAATTPRKKVFEILSCRCCNSNTEPKRRFHLFGDHATAEGFVNAIKQLTGIEVAEDDDYSNHICRNCATSIPKLFKRWYDFKTKCEETVSKQRDELCSVRSKRIHKPDDDVQAEEQSPLPQQPSKRPSLEKRVVPQSLENRFRKIAPKPAAPSRLQHHPDADVLQTTSANLRMQGNQYRRLPLPPLSDELTIISKSGLLGIKVK
jgi:hypothetical protein